MMVVNLATGKEWRYGDSLTPKEALMCCWYQRQGDYNIWNYDMNKVPIVEGEKTYSAGDLCVLKVQKKEKS